MTSPNTSATGGYLAPAPPGPAEDDDLEDRIHDVIAGVTGLPGNMVRPAFQLEPPDQLDVDVDWAAFRIVSQDPDANAYVRHDPTGDGADQLQRHEALEVLCSFYGPNAQAFAAIFIDGFEIAQNRDGLKAAGMNFTSAGLAVRLPELVNNRWYDRFDVQLQLTQQVNRTYPVLNLVGAQGVIKVDGQIDAEALVIPFAVNPK